MITINDVRAAAARIAPYVRKTPLVSARCMRDNPFPDGELLLKLECLQATGSFKALRPSVRVIGIEPTGSPTLYESVKAGRVVELKEITTIVPTMACAKTEPINLEIVRRHVDEIVLVTDDDMREAARWLWFEMGLAADLSGAASIAALRSGKVRPPKGHKVCALVCGAGPDGMV